MRYFLIGCFLLFMTTNCLASVSCIDVDYGTENYSDNMDRLAKEAKLPGDSWTRYDEDVVRSICKDGGAGIQNEIKNGYVKKEEVDRIKADLVVPKPIDLKNINYAQARKKFADMGLCSACQDNVAQHLLKTPSSQCGILAQHALQGYSSAIEELKTFPNYCVWNYSVSQPHAQTGNPDTSHKSQENLNPSIYAAVKKHENEVSKLGFTQAQLKSMIYLYPDGVNRPKPFLTYEQALSLFYEIPGTIIKSVEWNDTKGIQVRSQGTEPIAYLFSFDNGDAFMEAIAVGFEGKVIPLRSQGDKADVGLKFMQVLSTALK